MTTPSDDTYNPHDLSRFDGMETITILERAIHDCRNRLNPILGYSQLLQRELENSPLKEAVEQDNFLQIALETIHRHSREMESIFATLAAYTNEQRKSAPPAEESETSNLPR